MMSKDNLKEEKRIGRLFALENVTWAERVKTKRTKKAQTPKREPLSDEDICEILLKKEWKGFVDLVRIIEKAHGIGG